MTAIPQEAATLLDEAWQLISRVREAAWGEVIEEPWPEDAETWRKRYFAARFGAAAEADSGPELPEGEWGRIEMPGYRQHIGWVTEGTRFGHPVAVIRNWDGIVVAEVAIGPGCRFVHLPTPLKRPGPQQAAITSAPWGDSGDYDEDEQR